MPRTAEEILQDIVADVDAMVVEGGWLGPFPEDGSMDEGAEPLIRWPNLTVLIEEAKEALNA